MQQVTINPCKRPAISAGHRGRTIDRLRSYSLDTHDLNVDAFPCYHLKGHFLEDANNAQAEGLNADSLAFRIPADFTGTVLVSRGLKVDGHLYSHRRWQVKLVLEFGVVVEVIR